MNINKEKVRMLVEYAFKEGVDETLVTLLTQDHPTSVKWKEFIHDQWDAEKSHLEKKLMLFL